MDAQQALADLTEISSQVQAAVVFDVEGKVAASTLPQGDAFARAVADLLAAADELRPAASPLKQLEVATAEGSVFVVRQDEVIIAATTAPNPTVGLVFYDLKSALRSAEAAKRPVRDSGPGEGVRGNREVPPTKKAGPKKPAAKRPVRDSGSGEEVRSASKPTAKKPAAKKPLRGSRSGEGTPASAKDAAVKKPRKKKPDAS